jgi:hypothetical protein
MAVTYSLNDGYIFHTIGKYLQPDKCAGGYAVTCFTQFLCIYIHMSCEYTTLRIFVCIYIHMSCKYTTLRIFVCIYPILAF